MSFLLEELKPVFLSLALLAIPFILLFIEGKKRRQIPRELLLTKFEWRKALPTGMRLFLTSFLIIFVEAIILSFLGLLDSEKVVEVILDTSTLVLLAAVTIVPIAEELLFRSYLVPRIGVVLSALLFAAFHYGYGSVSEIVAALTVGVILGLHIRRNKDYYSCVIAHAAYNSFSIIMTLSLYK